MADPAAPPVSDPNKPGTQTSEFSVLALGVGICAATLAGLGVTLGQLHDLLPQAGWIGIALSAVTALAGLVATVSKYIGGRSDVKVAQLGVQTAQLQVQAAQAVAAVAATKPVTVATVTPSAHP